MLRSLALVLAALLTLGALGACTATERVGTTIRLSELSGQARAASKKGDDERALELWRRYIERRPHSHSAEYELGRVETRLGLYSDAIKHLTIAHDLRPANNDYIRALAEAHRLAGEPEKMMTLLSRTEQETPSMQSALRTTEFARRAGLMDDARDALRRAIAIGGAQSPEPHLALASFAQTIGDEDLEIEALRRALWFDPDSRAHDARLMMLGVTPGPSLALNPLVKYDFSLQP